MTLTSEQAALMALARLNVEVLEEAFGKREAAAIEVQANRARRCDGCQSLRADWSPMAGPAGAYGYKTRTDRCRHLGIDIQEPERFHCADFKPKGGRVSDG